jgi:hypothetical protein
MKYIVGEWINDKRTIFKKFKNRTI